MDIRLGGQHNQRQAPARQLVRCVRDTAHPAAGSRHPAGAYFAFLSSRRICSSASITSSRETRLRAKLSPDEQALLTLRVDRELEWREIARVLADDELADDAAVTRAAAGLRKKFERLKEKLRRLAAEDPEP